MYITDRHIDPRRAMELRDSRMIHVDERAMANCPTQAMHHEWPKEKYGLYIVDPGISMR